MSDVNLGVAGVVQLVTAELSDDELSALYLTIHLENDPRYTGWYPKTWELFTEANGTRMHPHTQDALEQVIRERLGDKLFITY